MCHSLGIRDSFYLSWLYLIIGKTTADILVQNNFSYNESTIKLQVGEKLLTKQEGIYKNSRGSRLSADYKATVWEKEPGLG